MIARVASIAIIVSALARAVCADPIQLQPSRFITGHVSITDATGMRAREFIDQSTTADGTFDASAGATAETDIASLSIAASQHTTIDAAANHFSGSGAASVSDLSGEVKEVDVTRVASSFILDFVLSRPMAYRFTATTSITGDISVYTFLEDGILGGRVWEGPGTATRLHQEGVLLPGTYNFLITAETSDLRPTLSSSGAYEFDLALSEVTPTPEPASLMLVSTGIVGAVRSRRRRVRTS